MVPEERVGERPRAGPPNLQQQLHHAQAVVFHGVDEWRAAALNVLGQGGKVFKSLQGLPRQPAVRRRTARSSVAIRLETPEHHPPTRRSPAPAPPPLTPPLLAPPQARAPALTTASMSAPRSSKSSTASWHSVFTATCRAVSPEGEGDSVKPGPGALQPQEDAGSCQTAPPCARVGAHRRNCGPPGPLCQEPRCPAGPAGRSGCGARTPGGLPSGHGGPVPWGWHQPSPRAEPQMATW